MSRVSKTFSEASKPSLGICAMDCKARSGPMNEILSRINEKNDFNIVIFGNHCILETPVDEWPICDFLISFCSTGFPLEKAEAYVNLRNPWCINNVFTQRHLFSRQKIHKILKENDIPIPNVLSVDCDENGSLLCELVESEDFIEVNGQRLNKPFVEKPADADDHNVYVYYPRSMGGGCRKLFRKTANESSKYFPEINKIRRGGTFLYEEFLPVQELQDVKVYALGHTYTFAEKRKSPAVDGKVEREASGKEKRIVTELTEQEKEIARKVVTAFKQTVCGFDLLRTAKGSFVCDVNGWSFVKKCPEYYDECGRILREWCLSRIGKPPHPESPSHSRRTPPVEIPRGAASHVASASSPATPTRSDLLSSKHLSPKFKRHKCPFGGESIPHLDDLHLDDHMTKSLKQGSPSDQQPATSPTSRPGLHRADSKQLLNRFIMHEEEEEDDLSEHLESVVGRNTGYRDSRF